MRITVQQREEPTVIGRRKFFVDFNILFSEAEKAVIRNRQLGEHFITVGSEYSLPAWTIATKLGYGFWGLRILSRILHFAMWISIYPIVLQYWPVRVFWLLGASSLAVFLFRKFAERNIDKALEKREMNLARLVKNANFTVYAPDAYNAKLTEQEVCGGLAALKEKMIAVAPGLAEKQVYELQ